MARSTSFGHGFLAIISVSLCFLLPVSAQEMAQAKEFDPLALESAPVEKVETGGGMKVFLEGSIGATSTRFGQSDYDTQRASLDLSYSGRVAPGLRAVFSDRIDILHPAATGIGSTVNSLREAYLSWQIEGAGSIVDVGRINVRSGPGYGYNPTDFFRDGSLRVLTSADPFALRQNRLGSVMLRGQKIWLDGSLSIAVSPKLASRPSSDGWGLDLGSTNNRNRALMTLGSKLSESLNTQVMLYKEEGLSASMGASMTALLSDATVAHLEWTRGSEPDLLSRVLPTAARSATRNRFVGGVTYTTLGKTSITAEYQYNGFGLDKASWTNLGGTPGAQLAYLGGALRLQELARQQAVLIYVTQKSLFVKDLDMTAYLRFSPGDNSKLAWIELRHHWQKFDLAFQLQQTMGSPRTEFGALPERRAVQILGTYYF
jgi:hypothetical protein